MYQYILFDLDGTLTEPDEGITNSVKYALRKFGIIVENTSELYKFIGPPLQDSFRDFYGFSHTQCEQAVQYYREYYNDKGLFENKVYPETFRLLKTLKENDRFVILATSKPEYYAVQILEHFKLTPYFDYICGANMDGTRTQKTDVISYAMKKAKISDLSQAVMVGDRKHDVIGAQNSGIASIGILFGYGDQNELENANATYIAKTVDDILKIII